MHEDSIQSFHIEIVVLGSFLKAVEKVLVKCITHIFTFLRITHLCISKVIKYSFCSWAGWELWTYF